MSRKNWNQIIWVIIAILAIIGVFFFTSCTKENSAIISTKPSSIYVRVQSIDVDSKINYSTEMHYTN